MSEPSPIHRFFAPWLAGARREKIIWLAVATIMALQVYPGDESFFVRHFGSGRASGPDLDWDKYTYHHFATLVLFALIPVLIIKTVLKESLRDYGVALGDWRLGLKMTALALVVMPPMIWLSSSDPQFLAEYPLTMRAMDSPTLFAEWALIYLVYYIGWEMFFRGFIGFGLRRPLGDFHAMMAQTAMSTIIHIGKPMGETFSAIPGGIYMGLLALRTRSLLWPLLFHWYIGLLNTLFCGMHR